MAVSGHTGEYGTNPNTVSDSQYLGITKWRDGISVSPASLAVYKALYNVGISIIGLPLVASPPANTSVSANIIYAKRIANLGPGALYALEGPNEPSNFPLAYNGVSSGSPSTTFVPVAQFQRDYYAAIKADSTLANVPVWSPTLIGEEPDNSGLQYLKVPTPLPSGVLMPAGTIFADVANMH